MLVLNRGTFALRQEGNMLLFPRVPQFYMALLTEPRRLRLVSIAPIPINIALLTVTEGAPATSVDGIRLRSTSEIFDGVH